MCQRLCHQNQHWCQQVTRCQKLNEILNISNMQIKHGIQWIQKIILGTLNTLNTLNWFISFIDLFYCLSNPFIQILFCSFRNFIFHILIFTVVILLRHLSIENNIYREMFIDYFLLVWVTLIHLITIYKTQTHYKKYETKLINIS